MALKEALPLIESGGVNRQKQDEALSCMAPKIEKGMCKLSFNMSAEELGNLIRGLYPSPCAYIEYKGLKIKIHSAKEALAEGFTADGDAGTILNVDTKGILINTVKGLLLITEIQAPNKRKMPVGEYIKGNSIEVGYRF